MKKLLLALLAVAGLAPALAQNAYPLFAPADGVLVGNSNTYVTTAATSADIRALWSGTCDITTFLRGNGACAQVDLTTNVTGTLPVLNGGTGVTALGTLTKADDTNVTLTLGGTPANSLVRSVSVTAGWTGTLAAARGGLGFGAVTDDTIPIANGSVWQPKALPGCLDSAGNHLNYDTSTNTVSCGTSGTGGLTGLANPTGLIGMTGVNGSASTATRSDGHSAIDPAIAPTWTGTHLFTGAIGGSGTTALSAGLVSTLPTAQWNVSTAAADAKRWHAIADTTGLFFRAVNDASSVNRDFMVATRSGVAIANLSLGNATDNPTFAFLGTGAGTVDGQWTYSTAVGGTNSPVTLASGTPGMQWVETDGAVNTKRMRFFQNSGVFHAGFSDDAGSSSDFLQATRSTSTVSDVSFGNATSNPTFNFLGSGLSTWGGALQINGDHVGQTNTDNYYQSVESDQGADGKVWWWRYNGGNVQLQTRTDAFAAGADALAISRTGTAIAALSFGNATNNPSYTFLGTGAAIVNGSLTVNNVFRAIGGPAPIRMNAADATGDNYLQAYSSDGTTSRWYIGNGGSADNNVQFSNDNSGSSLSILTTGNGNIVANAGSGSVTVTAGSAALPSSTTAGGSLVCRADGTNCPASGTTQGTATATFNGFTAGLTRTLTYSVTGSIACFSIPSGTGTSNTTAFTITGVPAAVQTTSVVASGVMEVEDNGVIKFAYWRMPSGSGTITFSNGINGTAFTNSGTKGIDDNFTACYNRN